MTRTARLSATRMALVTVVLLFLEIACRLGFVSPLTLVPPSEIGAEIVGLVASGAIAADAAKTFATTILAFALSVSLGVLCAALIHPLPRLRKAIDPFLVSFYAIPTFIFYPILVAIFGLNSIPLLLLALLFATPAMVLSTLTSLDRVRQPLLKMARIFRMSRANTFFRIILPASFMGLISGAKLTFAYSFIAIVAGEFLLSPSGLGQAVSAAYESFENRRMYALMALIIIIAVVLNSILTRVEMHFAQRTTRI